MAADAGLSAASDISVPSANPAGYVTVPLALQVPLVLAALLVSGVISGSMSRFESQAALCYWPVRISFILLPCLWVGRRSSSGQCGPEAAEGCTPGERAVTTQPPAKPDDSSGSQHGKPRCGATAKPDDSSGSQHAKPLRRYSEA